MASAVPGLPIHIKSRSTGVMRTGLSHGAVDLKSSDSGVPGLPFWLPRDHFGHLGAHFGRPWGSFWWPGPPALKEALGGHRLIFSGFWVALGSLLGVALAPLGRLLSDFGAQRACWNAGLFLKVFRLQKMIAGQGLDVVKP